MQRLAPQWLAGCKLRECWFEPTFHKHAGMLCNALMIHAEGAFYDHAQFRPWRLPALAFKSIRRLYPDYDLWREFPYEDRKRVVLGRRISVRVDYGVRRLLNQH